MPLPSEQESMDDEILNGTFELMMTDYAKQVRDRTQLPSVPRVNLPNVTTIPGVDGLELRVPPIDLSSLEDILKTTDRSPKPLTAPRTPAGPTVHSCTDEYRTDHACGGLLLQQKFQRALQREMCKEFGVDVEISQGTDRTQLQTPIYIITFESQHEEKSRKARQTLRALLKSITIKIIDEQSGPWTQTSDCVRIFQAHSDQNDSLHVFCEHSTIGLHISYFADRSSLSNLCTDNDTLDKILQEKFRAIDVKLPASSDLVIENKSFFAQEILQLHSDIRLQPVFMGLEQRCIHLFGLTDVVADVEKRIEAINKKYASNIVKLNLTADQIQHLLEIHSAELQDLEKQNNGVQIVQCLPKGEFTAPGFMQERIKQRILELSALCPPTHLEITDEAFRPIAHDQCAHLVQIGRQHKCRVTIDETSDDYVCEIPQATANDHVSNKLTAAAITVEQGDLADQKVDLVVLSTNSYYLCENIFNKAGSFVEQQHNAARQQSPTALIEIDSGALKCRKLLFLHWKVDQTDDDIFARSIREFVRTAVGHAIKAHYTSIAFPSIGCGKLNVGEQLVANEMLIEAQKQLLSGNVLLQIKFIILPTETRVFQAFESKLASLQQGDVETKDKQVAYRLSTLKLTLVSSNQQQQDACEQAIKNHVQQSIVEREHTQRTGLKRWTQPALNKFFHFCEERQVVVEIDVCIGFVKLYGAQQSVLEAENEFLAVYASQSEQARLAEIAREIIWAYQIDEKNWEKYPPERNAHIEDQHSAKLASFEYTDESSQKKYVIDFKAMTETCPGTNEQRKVVRQDKFAVPEYWQIQLKSVDQFSVALNTPEYVDIINFFNATIAGKCQEIARLDRIQNQQWYMQYNAYFTFSPKKDTEKRLFHGCSQQTAMLIINSFFNRSFAGINGILYGQGAYFSSKAAYSHAYTTADQSTGERCMFVVRVLVGNTTKGNKSMKTPPAGYDSTTDGDHIFVTYRDDQAYAAYLIIYK